jgi:hypothetical protein
MSFPDDPRLRRLFDLQPHEGVEAICGACGRIVVFPSGLLQRRYRLPSYTLIIDLQYRLRCVHYNARRGFEIAVVETTYPDGLATGTPNHLRAGMGGAEPTARTQGAIARRRHLTAAEQVVPHQ